MCLTVQMALALRLGGVGSISQEDKDDDGRISVTKQMAPPEKSVKLLRQCRMRLTTGFILQYLNYIQQNIYQDCLLEILRQRSPKFQ